VAAKLVQQLGTGRRKTATARVFLRTGKGQITVNNRPFEHYFVNESARAYVRQPLLATETADRRGERTGWGGAPRHCPGVN
jgi:small subunit ribosomal protein S9